MDGNIDRLSINSIRMLGLDMIQKANSGHPGIVLDGSPLVYTLFSRFMKHNPFNPNWYDRDRFVLSAGHGSAMLYSLLHHFGYDISMDELKRFRQAGSITPGHPEYGATPGVEATTGPLGQGFAMGVGMAIAENVLAGCYNKGDIKIVNHYTYGFISDGDLMEGVTSEAASLAGTLKLGKLIYLYADNNISLEGSTDMSFNENVNERFKAYGWHTLRVDDGNDIDKIEQAIKDAQYVTDMPTIITIKTHIGFGSPKQDTAAAHGEAFKEDELKTTKEFFKWPLDKTFNVPDGVVEHLKTYIDKGPVAESKWNLIFEEYKKIHPKDAELFELYQKGDLNPELKENIPVFDGDEPMATRVASGKVMQVVETYMSEFIGGSADLNPSTKTYLDGYGDVGVSEHCARNIHYGVREHAMGAITNGLALHGGMMPYSATFFAFFDYMKPAVRMGALMNLNTVYIFTHDSIALGEDGPTHQPIEQLISARAIPNVTVLRPADANETVAAWFQAMSIKNPVVLVLSRQNLPVLDTKKYNTFDGVAKGGYVLIDTVKEPDVLLIATGSEVHLAMAASKTLKEKGINARVISMPSYEIFNMQDEKYKESVIPAKVKKRLIIEAGATIGWWKLAGENGDVLGVDKFGQSAPGNVVLENYGFTVENVVERVGQLLNKK